MAIPARLLHDFEDVAAFGLMRVGRSDAPGDVIGAGLERFLAHRQAFGVIRSGMRVTIVYARALRVMHLDGALNFGSTPSVNSMATSDGCGLHGGIGGRR